MIRAFIILILFSTNARADDSSLLKHFQSDCRLSHFSKIMFDDIKKRHPKIVHEYEERALELGAYRFRLREYGPLTDRHLEGMERNLSSFYQEKIAPMVDQARLPLRKTPYLGVISKEDPVEIPILIRGKLGKASLHGEVKEETQGYLHYALHDPHVEYRGKKYYIAAKFYVNTPREIGLHLGYTGGSGSGQYEVVHSANPLHWTNWLMPLIGKDPRIGLLRRYVIYDAEKAAFRPIEAKDFEGPYWMYFFPKRIHLDAPK